MSGPSGEVPVVVDVYVLSSSRQILCPKFSSRYFALRRYCACVCHTLDVNCVPCRSGFRSKVLNVEYTAVSETGYRRSRIHFADSLLPYKISQI